VNGTPGPPPRLATPANLLGLVRIAATPIVMVLVLAGDPMARLVAFVVFCVAGATDFLDGRIARARNEVSPLGVFMDLVADKVLVAGALVAMVAIDLVPAWMAATILVREFVVQSVRQIAAAEDTVISAAILGKVKTVTTLGGLALLILSTALAGSGGAATVRTTGDAVMLLATALTVVSGAMYMRDAWPLISGRSHSRPSEPASIDERHELEESTGR
jgi:CDP-diacylglycerol---glycerol-3-phosphate 3-phosphatidyltransferase